MCPVIYHRRCKPSLPSSHPQRRVTTASHWLIRTIFFISMTTNNTIVKMTYDPLRIILAAVPLVSCLLHPPLRDFFQRSVRVFPTYGITNMNTMSILSSVAWDLMLIYFLLLVHLVGSVPQHFSSPVHRQSLRITKWAAKWFPVDLYADDPPQ